MINVEFIHSYSRETLLASDEFALSVVIILAF